MKILLINPPYTNFEGIKESGGHSMPLNLAYLAAYLRERIKCEIVILDAEVRGLGYDQIKQIVCAKNPDLVGITCPTPTMNHVLKITQIIKTEIDNKIITVVGGIHPTVFPKETIQNPYIDFLVAGEGEITFYELVDAILKKPNNFSEIKGLFYKRENKIIANQARPLIANLDMIPFPARDLFDLDLYYPAVTKRVAKGRAGAILTSRGCAFFCAHCISQKMWGRNVRFRSTNNVITEIEECITKYKFRELNVWDDTFTLNQKRAAEICDLIISKKINLAWLAMSRANTLSESLVVKMKLAGCKQISFGLESGSQKILDLMKKNATLEMGRNAVNIVSRNELITHSSFMLGNIGETEETIKETIAYAKSLPLDNATFFITSPYPGTALYDVAINEGFISKNTKWEEFAPLTNAPPILVQRNVPADKLIYWQKRGFREFYFRPSLIWRKIKHINSIEFIKVLLEGVRILFRILGKKTQT